MHNGAMTAAEFRRLALSLPEAIESEHMGHPDFRVSGKIFATLSSDESLGMVKLTPEQQQGFVEEEPSTFVPVKGGWGLKGATHVKLSKAKKEIVRTALETAWRNIAAKSRK